MGVTKRVITPGNGTDIPKKGDQVTIEYTGNLYDPEKGKEADYRGKQYVIQKPARQTIAGDGTHQADLCPPAVRFDSSVGRGDFKTPIGVGKVIKGSTGFRYF